MYFYVYIYIYICWGRNSSQVYVCVCWGIEGVGSQLTLPPSSTHEPLPQRCGASEGVAGPRSGRPEGTGTSVFCWGLSTWGGGRNTPQCEWFPFFNFDFPANGQASKMVASRRKPIVRSWFLGSVGSREDATLVLPTRSSFGKRGVLLSSSSLLFCFVARLSVCLLASPLASPSVCLSCLPVCQSFVFFFSPSAHRMYFVVLGNWVGNTWGLINIPCPRMIMGSLSH